MRAIWEIGYVFQIDQLKTASKHNLDLMTVMYTYVRSELVCLFDGFWGVEGGQDSPHQVDVKPPQITLTLAD